LFYPKADDFSQSLLYSPKNGAFCKFLREQVPGGTALRLNFLPDLILLIYLYENFPQVLPVASLVFVGYFLNWMEGDQKRVLCWKGVVRNDQKSLFAL